MLEAIVLAIALAMDATAVAAARSVSGVSRRELVALAFSFGVFQAGMAAAGLALGVSAAGWIASWDHWLAFGLLVLIGGKMLFEALRADPAELRSSTLGLRTILVLSIATSIDALAAGVTLPTVSAPAAITIVLIGVTSFVLSLLGSLVGWFLGRRVGRALEIAGGVALIGIGVKTLVDHLMIG